MRPHPDPVGPGQRSGWQFPRPAIAEPCDAHVVIKCRGMTIADTRASIRTLETRHPPSYFAGSSFCEWKGVATYWDVIIGDILLSKVGWSYPGPSHAFATLRDHVAFYAAAFDRCSVDGVTVVPQSGGFHGGWATPDLAGPFRGVPGSTGW